MLPLLLAVVVAACSDTTESQLVLPTAIERVGGDGQQGAVASVLADPLVVRVLDSRERPLAGVQVAWTIQSGDGSVSVGSSTTNTEGEAATQWTLGTVAGEQQLVASVDGVAPGTFTATALPGAVTVLVDVAGNHQQGFFGGALPTPLKVRAEDSFGNGVPGVQVAWVVVSGGGTIDPGTTVTDAQGEATVQWTLGIGSDEQEAMATLPGVTHSFNALATVSADFNLFVETIHLNQGSQAADGSVGGIAGRPGVLRVVVRANAVNAFSPDVLVRLQVGDRGEIREVLVPAPRVGVPTSVNLSNENDTWNLPLSAAEVGAELLVSATVDPNGIFPSTTRADNQYPPGDGFLELDVQALAPLNIVFIPMRLTSRNNIVGNINPGNVETYLAAVRQWIPSAAIVPTFRGTFSTDLNMGLSSSWSQLLGDVQALRTADGATDEYYHGIVPDFPGIPIGGIAFLPGSPDAPWRSALSYDRLPVSSEVIAHELGHNFNRRHVDCGNPANPDPGYPYQDGRVGMMGYDILSGTFRHPGSFRDYMSYCRPSWTSDYTFQAILSWRRQDPLAAPFALPHTAGARTAAARPAGTAAAGAGRTRVAEPGLLIWGMINSGGVSLNPAFALSAPPALPDGGGPYVLRGTAADGRELFRYAFRGVGVAHAADPAEEHFVFFVPLRPAEIEAVASIEVVGPRGRAERRAEQPAVPGQPPAALRGADTAVRFTPEPGGETRMSWTAERYPMALVRDAASGRIVAIARSGAVQLPADAPRPDRLEVLLSDGVSSRKGWQQ